MNSLGINFYYLLFLLFTFRSSLIMLSHSVKHITPLPAGGGVGGEALYPLLPIIISQHTLRHIPFYRIYYQLGYGMAHKVFCSE